jgi:hypothetical protein
MYKELILSKSKYMSEEHVKCTIQGKKLKQTDLMIKKKVKFCTD